MNNNHHNLFHYFFSIFYNLIKDIFHSIFWLIVGILGYYLLLFKGSPYDILLGLPFLLVGGSFVINSLLNVFLSIFSLKYNKLYCHFCANHPFENHKKVKEILGINGVKIL